MRVVIEDVAVIVVRGRETIDVGHAIGGRRVGGSEAIRASRFGDVSKRSRPVSVIGKSLCCRAATVGAGEQSVEGADAVIQSAYQDGCDGRQSPQGTQIPTPLRPSAPTRRLSFLAQPSFHKPNFNTKRGNRQRKAKP